MPSRAPAVSKNPGRNSVDPFDPLALTDGEWRPVRGILRFVAALPEPPTTADSPGDLIACPTCHARLWQHCRTTTGRHRAPHDTRLVSRRCTCGGALGPGRQLCDACRDTARRDHGRLSMRNTRARRKAAA